MAGFKTTGKKPQRQQRRLQLSHELPNGNDIVGGAVSAAVPPKQWLATAYGNAVLGSTSPLYVADSHCRDALQPAPTNGNQRWRVGGASSREAKTQCKVNREGRPATRLLLLLPGVAVTAAVADADTIWSSEVLKFSTLGNSLCLKLKKKKKLLPLLGLHQMLRLTLLLPAWHWLLCWPGPGPAAAGKGVPACL